MESRRESEARRRGVVHSFAWSFVEQGGSKAAALVIQIVLARLLAPDAFGVLAILLVVIEVANSIAQSGLGMSLIQKSDASNESFSTALWLSLGLSAVLYVILFAIAPLVAQMYEMPELSAYLRVLSLVVFTNAANSIQRAHLQRSFRFKELCKVNIVAVVLAGFLGILAAVAGWGIWALVLQSLSLSVITFVAFLFVVPWKPALVFDRGEARSLFSYGWKICITGILNVLYIGVSELIVGKACSPAALGYYSQGRKWPNAAISMASNALQNVLFPVFSTLKQDGLALRRALEKAIKVGTFVVAPISLVFAVISEPFVGLLLGDKWLPCVPVFQLTCLPNCLLMLQLVNLRAYMAVGDSGLYLKLQTIKVALGVLIIGTTAAVSRDIYCVAIAAAAVGALSILLVDLRPSGRMLGYGARSQLAAALPAIGLSTFAALSSLPVSFLGLAYLPCLVLQVVVFSFLYLLGAWLLRVPGLGEVREVLGRLKGGGASRGSR